MSLILAPFPDMVPLASELAPLLGADVAPIGWRHFPDGESLVTLPPVPAGAEMAVVATLRDPDRLALPLRFAAATARELGAGRVGLIAPYLGYMRQDMRFHPGEAVSAPLFAAYLGQCFDWLVTVDPHLHRNPELAGLFEIPAENAHAAPALAAWIRAELPDAVLLGPDSESQQWVARVAELAGRPYEVLRKHRSGDREVEVSLPDRAVLRAGTPVLLDDIASSGRTLVRTLEHLSQAGTATPVCVVIHALFAGEAHQEILAAGAGRIISTNTVPHASNAITIAPALAKSARRLISFVQGP